MVAYICLGAEESSLVKLVFLSQGSLQGHQVDGGASWASVMLFMARDTSTHSQASDMAEGEDNVDATDGDAPM